MVNYKKRLYAYLFDIFILMTILFIISIIIPRNNNIISLENSLTDLNLLLNSGLINFFEYLNKYSMIIHDIDIENSIYSIINAFFIIIYFVLIPFYKDGQTFGAKIFKIKIAPKDKEILTVRALMIRSMVINGLFYMLISLASIYLIPKSLYFLVISILGLIQLYIVIKSAFMVKYSKDKEGLQDKFSKTYVIENIEVK